MDNSSPRIASVNWKKVGVVVAAILVVYIPVAIWKYNDRQNNELPKTLQTTEDVDRAAKQLERDREAVEQEAKKYGKPIE